MVTSTDLAVCIQMTANEQTQQPCWGSIPWRKTDRSSRRRVGAHCPLPSRHDQWSQMSDSRKQTLTLRLWTFKDTFFKETGFPGDSYGRESACNARDLGLIPGSGRSPREENACLLQYSYLENSMDRRAWQTVARQAPLSMGSQRVGHYWATNTFIYTIKRTPSHPLEYLVVRVQPEFLVQ